MHATGLLGAGMLATGVFGVGMWWRIRARLCSQADQIRRADTAVVFGAGVLADGRPSAMLYERVRAAAELVHAGRVERLLLSGDGHGSRGHDEVAVMVEIAVHFGLQREVLLEDRRGTSTAATLEQAVGSFRLTDLVLVTQRFHAYRCAWLASALPVQVQVLALPDIGRYGRRVVIPLRLRECLAFGKAFSDRAQLRWNVQRRRTS